jgi:hypothetical protein
MPCTVATIPLVRGHSRCWSSGLGGECARLKACDAASLRGERRVPSGQRPIQAGRACCLMREKAFLRVSLGLGGGSWYRGGHLGPRLARGESQPALRDATHEIDWASFVQSRETRIMSIAWHVSLDESQRCPVASLHSGLSAPLCPLCTHPERPPKERNHPYQLALGKVPAAAQHARAHRDVLCEVKVGV